MLKFLTRQLTLFASFIEMKVSYWHADDHVDDQISVDNVVSLTSAVQLNHFCDRWEVQSRYFLKWFQYCAYGAL